jgi:prevent-host-death family protein
MQQYNIHAAKTQLSALVEKAAKGEAFIIAKAGKPMVKVIPCMPESANQKRVGFLKGEITIPDDFDRMGQKEIAEAFAVEFYVSGRAL